MNLDLLTLKLLEKELCAHLVGRKVEKIFQPEIDELRFVLRGTKKTLLVSTSPQMPRICMTETKKQNPMTAPAFLMLARKHLVGTVIENFSLFNDDRIFKIEFCGKNEMKDESRFFLYVELMGRRSNIILTDSKNTILDAIKKFEFSTENSRAIIRGLFYEPPFKTKIDFTTALNNENAITFCFEDFCKNCNGISTDTQNAIQTFANNKFSLESQRQEFIFSFLQNIDTFVDSNDYYPTLQNGKFTFFKSSSTENQKTSLNKLIDNLFSQKDEEIRLKNKIKPLKNLVANLEKKTMKNLDFDIQHLKETEKMDDLRVCGELIVSNIYKLKKGDENFEAFNYYTSTTQQIELNPQLTPSKNATAYFEKYSKLKRAKEFLTTKIEKDKSMLDYIQSIAENLNLLTIEDNFLEIELELESIGAKRQNKQKQNKKEKPLPPTIYNIDGFTVMKGRNNVQNDNLTFKIASSNDLWFHLKNFHGAHVVLFTNGKIPDEKIILTTAEIASSSQNARCEVDYTQRKNVKRQPNGHLGQVFYTNFKTVNVEPCEHVELIVKS